MSNKKVAEIYRLANLDQVLKDPEVAYLSLDFNKIIGSHSVPGLQVDVEEKEDGIKAKILLEEGVRISKPVQMCFGVTKKEAVQKIDLEIKLQSNSQVEILAHCVFPQAVKVKHIMDAHIEVGEGASYRYFERHIHGKGGGVEVYPTAKVVLAPKAQFRTDFELIKGRVGLIDINYETTCQEDSVMEMTAKISGRGDDKIKIREVGYLIGQRSRGVLTSRVAVRDQAQAEVFNKLIAEAPFARGHVDCKEIIKDQGIAKAIPIVEVKDPQAHVTHEAAIGSVDNKQLETLMSRGLDEDEATDLIIQGLLS